MVEAVAAGSDTLRYDWFVSAGGRSCVVGEIYASSDVLVVHLQHVGERIGPMVELGGGVGVEAFGDPTPDLREAVAGFGTTWYASLR